MSTRASLRFIDEYANVVYVYRGHDGFPEIVEPDIDRVLSIAQGRWSGSEVSLLVTLFLAVTYTGWQKQRLPDYELTTSIHGDEEYFYIVRWNTAKQAWVREETHN
jgi:hypothetical protein